MSAPSSYGKLATTLTPVYTTVYNQSVLVPAGDTQIIQFQPAATTENESVVGWTFAFYISNPDDFNGAKTILTVGSGITVVDASIPIIQVNLPAGIKTLRGYSLISLTPQRRTMAQGTIIVQPSASTG